MTVEVKQEHIDKGHVGNCYACPVALALAEALSTSNDYTGYVSVGPVNIFFSTHRIITPESVFNFMQDFDNYVRVKPFTFELETVSNDN